LHDSDSKRTTNNIRREFAEWKRATRATIVKHDLGRREEQGVHLVEVPSFGEEFQKWFPESWR